MIITVETNGSLIRTTCARPGFAGRVFSLILVLLQQSAFVDIVSAQQVQIHTQSFLFSESPAARIISVGGTIDGENALSEIPGHAPCRVFEPNIRLSLRNNGSGIIPHVHLTLNNRGDWWDQQSLRSEMLKNLPPTEYSLALWRFASENSFHSFSPENAGDFEDRDPIKFFTLYGYGFCSDITGAMAGLAWLSNVPCRFWMTPGHVFPEVEFVDRFEVVDADLKAFYLLADNQTLASKADITNDRYLVCRTHKYGKASLPNGFADGVSGVVHLMMNDSASVVDRGYTFDMTLPFGFDYGHQLDIALRPGETLAYDYGPGRIFHAIGSSNLLPSDYANGTLEYLPPFGVVPTDTLVTNSFNVSVASAAPRRGLRATSVGGPSSFIIPVACPFIIVDGKVTARFVCPDSSDSVRVWFSRDSRSWTLVRCISGPFVQSDSIPLFEAIATKTRPALHNYYLKVEMIEGDSAGTTGVDSLSIVSTFQLCRYFLPRLVKGNNDLRYSDGSANGRDVSVDLMWQESSAFVPPDPPSAPSFPRDGSTVDSLKFTFTWMPAASQSGIGIIDYEFALSSRPDMKYPLSPTFSRYISAMHALLTPTFSIPLSGLLNSGQVYYWRVRAKDQNGIWSEWSPTWQFIAKGVMPPVPGSATIVGDTLFLQWEPNPSGMTPSYYRVYASNETHGFVPNTSSYLDSTSAVVYRMPLHGSAGLYSFYRISAVSPDGEEGGPSNVIEVHSPIFALRLSTAKPLLPFRSSLVGAKRFTPVWRADSNNPLNIDTVYHRTRITPLSSPGWLSVDSISGEFTGRPDSLAIGRMYYGIDSPIFRLRVTQDWAPDTIVEVNIPIEFLDRAPVVPDTEIHAVAGDTLAIDFVCTDPDIRFGDSLQCSVDDVPRWMRIRTDAGKVTLSAARGAIPLCDSSVVITVKDRAGKSDSRRINVRVQRPVSPPVFISHPPVAAKEDSLYTYTVRAVDPDSTYGFTPIRYGLLAPRSWLTVDSLTGIASGTPRGDNVKDSLVWIESRTGLGSISYQRFPLVVQHVNHPPSFTSTPVLYAAEDSLYEYHAAGADIDARLFGDRIRFHLVSPSTWLSMDSLSGILSGVPRRGDVGQLTVTIGLTDGNGGEASQAFVVGIAKTAHPPTMVPIPEITLHDDSVYSFTLGSLGWSPDSSPKPLKWTIDALVEEPIRILSRGNVSSAKNDQEIVLEIGEGELPGVNTPLRSDSLLRWNDSVLVVLDTVTTVAKMKPLGFYSGQTSKLVFSARDGNGLISRDTVSVRGIHTNRRPRFDRFPAYSMFENDSAAVLCQLWNSFVIDPDDPDSAHAWLVTGGHHTRANSSGPLVRVIPEPMFFGTDSLTVVVSDRGGLKDTARWVVNVNFVNHSPKLLSIPDTVAFAERPYRATLRSTDSDWIDTIRTYTVSGPGWISVDSAGELTGRPPRAGKFSVRVAVFDQHGGSDTLRFSLTVRPLDETRDIAGAVPVDFVLKQNYPNPFNPSTTIRFGLSERSRFTLSVFNILGQHVADLAADTREAGYYEVQWTPTVNSTGVYFAVLQGNSLEGSGRSFRFVKKMLMLR